MINESEKLRKLANLYRTKWLISHNYLHDIISKDERFSEYLDELKKAKEISVISA
jgi:hypothetical protein